MLSTQPSPFHNNHGRLGKLTWCGLSVVGPRHPLMLSTQPSPFHNNHGRFWQVNLVWLVSCRHPLMLSTQPSPFHNNSGRLGKLTWCGLLVVGIH